MKELFELYRALKKVKVDVAKIAKAFLDEYNETGADLAYEKHLYWAGFLEEMQYNINLIETGEHATLKQFQDRAAVALWHMGRHKYDPIVQGRIDMLYLIKDFEPVEE